MEDDNQKYSTVHYKNYLGLDQLLSAQHPRSGSPETEPAHDEMLFIIVHQAYELWFKQIIYELESVLTLFQKRKVDERNIGISIGRLNRVVEIQNLLIDQIRIMETMTPLDFLDFRGHLFPASGFQSYQFRMIENLLGLEESDRITYNGCPYFSVFEKAKQQKLKAVVQTGSLFQAIEDWLERTPFIELGDFDFIESYQLAVDRMVDKEQKAIRASDYLSAENKQMRLEMLAKTDQYFESVLDKNRHVQLQETGQLRLSYEATIAALFINLYRDEPILHLPFQLLTCFIEIDQALITWRYRHAQMVQRMLGNKVGTGGSSGHQYLHETARKHHIFQDLHNISTLLIPRSELPQLPANIKMALGYYYKHQSS
ncbi:MAG: tryptophan 2,3-dioxygenase family protein [Bacteroidota bacterium]